MHRLYTSFPNYEQYIADRKYAEIATALGVQGKSTEHSVRKLIERVRKLMSEVDIPHNLAEMGVDREAFAVQVLDMAQIAFDDQCTGANPRYPRVRELEDIYFQAYGS